VQSYTFVLFFLPDPEQSNAAGLPPGYWAKELAAYGGTSVPSNLTTTIGCWRIVFVVLEIIWNNGQTQRYADPHNWFPFLGG
jgi:hypothetical protein